MGRAIWGREVWCQHQTQLSRQALLQGRCPVPWHNHCDGNAIGGIVCAFARLRTTARLRAREVACGRRLRGCRARPGLAAASK